MHVENIKQLFCIKWNIYPWVSSRNYNLYVQSVYFSEKWHFQEYCLVANLQIILPSSLLKAYEVLRVTIKECESQISALCTQTYIIWHKILEGENFGKTFHAKNWQIIFWRMLKFVKVPKILIMCPLVLIKCNHRVLLWCGIKMKYFTIQKLARDTW